MTHLRLVLLILELNKITPHTIREELFFFEFFIIYVIIYIESEIAMNKNSILYEDYPVDSEVALPAKWIFVAEDLLDETQYKEWLFYTMRYMGFCGMIETGDVIVDMLLNAVYEEDEEFFERYWQSILKERQKHIPIADRLKVTRAWTKEEQQNARLNR